MQPLIEVTMVFMAGNMAGLRAESNPQSAVLSHPLI